MLIQYQGVTKIVGDPLRGQTPPSGLLIIRISGFAQFRKERSNFYEILDEILWKYWYQRIALAPFTEIK